MAIDQTGLTEILKDAKKAVDDAGLEGDLRLAGFERALDALIPGRSAAPPSTSRLPSERPPKIEEGSDSVLSKLASKAETTLEAVKHVFDYDGDRLTVVVGDSRIDQTAAGGTRELTLLVAGARQAADFEEWTSLARPRDTCSRYGRLDSSNFAATVVGMDDEFSFRGSGQSREVRLTMRGWERWQQLIARLAHGDE